MVIELSGVQFGLKWYAWFQNQTSAWREFDLKSLYYTHFEITKFFVNINIFLMSTSGKPVLNFDGLKKGCDLEHKVV